MGRRWSDIPWVVEEHDGPTRLRLCGRAATMNYAVAIAQHASENNPERRYTIRDANTSRGGVHEYLLEIRNGGELHPL